VRERAAWALDSTSVKIFYRCAQPMLSYLNPPARSLSLALAANLPCMLPFSYSLHFVISCKPHAVFVLDEWAKLLSDGIDCSKKKKCTNSTAVKENEKSQILKPAQNKSTASTDVLDLPPLSLNSTKDNQRTISNLLHPSTSANKNSLGDEKSQQDTGYLTQGSCPSGSQEVEDADCVYLPAGSFSIVLLVDSCEIEK